ncbi:MAG TPA: DUF4157 domain-containing protein [Thermoanaerobaculia bacterium]|jgi:hypothetical protein
MRANFDRQARPEATRGTPKAGRLLQRKCACGGTPGATGECAECQKKRLGLQRKESGLGGPAIAPPIVHEVLGSPGGALDGETRSFMESRFGHDFSRVRVHDDARAAESARTVGALAYTVGRDVVFNAGQYAPRTDGGRRLLAHELTHVIQQGPSATTDGSDLAVSPPDHPAERAADSAADAALAGSTPVVGTGTSSQVQRKPPGSDLNSGGTLPYREATELLKCIKIMGEDQAEYCRQEVLGEQPIRPTAGCGWFGVNMTPFVTGVEGTIEFYPDPKTCPKCNLIRLVQIVRVFEKPGQPYAFTGGEAPREKMKTKEDAKKNTKAGYFVDHFAKKCSEGKGCSIYYRDHAPNATKSQDGSNDGKTVSKASLWDHPFGDADDVFEFETCARCHDTGSYLGCVDWGFTADAAGTATLTSPFEHGVPSSTFDAAIAAFNKYYKNK